MDTKRTTSLPLRYFGPGVHAYLEKVDLPDDDLICAWCEEDIDLYDPGFVMDHISGAGITDTYYHQECMVRSTIGSVPHQRKECSCHGGCDKEDHMTKREAARAAMEESKKMWGDNHK